MDSPSHGWAVGYRYVDSDPYPTLLEYDGVAWIDRSYLVPPTVHRLYDIALDDNGNGWAVGSYGSTNQHNVMRLENGVWSANASVPTSLYSVANEAMGEAWAVGCNSAHYVGGQWIMQQDASAYCAESVSLVPGRGGWAVGGMGTILRYDPLEPGQTFYDVPPDNTFYPFIECMVSRGIISGYPEDNTFRPNSPVTRGQLSKIVSNSAGFSEPPGAQMFEDVPSGSPFYEWVQRLASRGYIEGYPCGGPGEPCGLGNLPYFRPGAGATRGQLTKIVSNAAGFADVIPNGQHTFSDVPPTHTFWVYVERLLLNRSGVMGGYACGGAGEPCDGQNRPYLRPNNPLTRGQTSKIVSNTFFPGCNPP